MKKLIAFLTACGVIFSCLSVAAATDRQIFDVTSLGIMQGDESGDLKLEEKVTRAEFAQIVLNLINMPASKLGNIEGGFSDVPAGAWYAPAVNYIAALGYISGEPNGTFRPEDNVLVQEAYKILIHVLGYEVAAKDLGAYPEGYLAQAGKLHLNDGITRGPAEEALRGDVLIMVYNALDIELLQKQYTDGSDAKYEIARGETLRKGFSDTASIYQIRGIVTADNNTWLLQPNANFNPGEIEIDGEIYIAHGVDTSQYLGLEVECYYYENKLTGKREIKSIAPTNNNHVVEFDTELFDSYQSGVLFYYPEEGEKTKRLILSEGCQVIYNNRLLTEFSDAIMDLGKGSCRLVDHNNDNQYDYLFIEQEETAVVDSVFETGEIYFKNTFTVGGGRYISVEPEETQNYRVLDKDGGALKLTDIQPDDVLTLMRSLDGTYIKLVRSQDVREAVISEIREDEALIDGVWCKISAPELDVQVGETFKGYFDYHGNLVYATDPDGFTSREKYGYIVRAAKASGLDEPRVLMLNAGSVTNREEENKENLDDKNKIATLYCSNESVQELTLNGRVRVNGSSYRIGEGGNSNSRAVSGGSGGSGGSSGGSGGSSSGSGGSSGGSVSEIPLNDLIGPVIYKTNAEGYITSIETPELVGGLKGQEIQYSAKEMVFGGNVIFGGFGIDENTRVCCVPSDPVSSMDDYLVDVKIDNRDSAQKFNAQGYVLNDVTNNVKFMVITRPMSTDTVTSTSYKSSSVGVVTERAIAIDEESRDEFYHITILSASGPAEYDAKNLNANNQVLSELKEGDMIYYELDHEGNLQNARLIVSIPSLTVSDYWQEATEFEALYGQVTSLELGVIDVVNTRRADLMYIQAGNTLEELYIPTRNAPVVFLYDEQREEYTVTTTANIREGVDNVYVAQPYGTPKALVIKR